jgi:hypothetical protein
MGTHVRAIDEVQAPIQTPCSVGYPLQGRQHSLPDVGLAPPVEATGHCLPVAEVLRKVPPRRACPVDPEGPFHDAPMVVGWASASPGALRGQEGLQLRPLRVG